MRLVAFGPHELVREVAFALIVSRKRPIRMHELAAASGVDDLWEIVDSLAREGWIDRAPDGSITGTAGLSLSDGPHSLYLRGTTFRTWCAYDALGIPAALGEDAEIHTECGVCRKQITVSVEAGQPVRPGPEMLWLAEGEGDLRTSFCTPTVLLCSAAHGEDWAAIHGNAGALLDLAAAADQGANDWATSADAARHIELADRDSTEVEYIGGPRDAEHETVSETAAVLPASEGEYRRSVRCADDGALRYVWHQGPGPAARSE